MKSSKKFIVTALSAIAFVVLFLGYVHLTTSDYRDLDFTKAVVVKKYRSPNHDYLSVRVQTAGGKEFAVEGIPLTSWDKIATGSKISKRAGSSDIAVDTP